MLMKNKLPEFDLENGMHRSTRCEERASRGFYRPLQQMYR